MNSEDIKSLEKKIDSLIEESEKAKIERKREKVLSKVDGLYNVLIALSTFIIGIIITQIKFLIGVDTVALLFAMVGVVLSMLFSFLIGFKGMVNDSMEKRVLSWVLLLTCFVSYMFTMLAFVANALFRPSIVVSIISSVLGVALFFIQIYFSKRFTKWLESKLSSRRESG
jgi:hypothetical protein